MKDCSEYFVRGVRKDGKVYFYLEDGTPGDIKDLVRDIHFNHFSSSVPCDWIYEQVYRIFDMFKERDFDLDDVLHDLECDTYNSDLIEWLHNSYASSFCNEAMEENNYTNIFDVLRAANRSAKEAIVFAVDGFLKERE